MEHAIMTAKQEAQMHRQHVERAFDELEAKLRTQSERVSGKVQELQDRVYGIQDRVFSFQDRIYDLQDRMQGFVSTSLEKPQQVIRRNPVRIALAIIAVGFIVGSRLDAKRRAARAAAPLPVGPVMPSDRLPVEVTEPLPRTPRAGDELDGSGRKQAL
jgi:hypothetical protein